MATVNRIGLSVLLFLNLFFVALLFYQNPWAASHTDDAPMVTHMAGDSEGVWFTMSNRRLVYCWRPADRQRRDRQADCRVMNEWGITRIQ